MINIELVNSVLTKYNIKLSTNGESNTIMYKDFDYNVNMKFFVWIDRICISCYRHTLNQYIEYVIDNEKDLDTFLNIIAKRMSVDIDVNLRKAFNNIIKKFTKKQIEILNKKNINYSYFESIALDTIGDEDRDIFAYQVNVNDKLDNNYSLYLEGVISDIFYTAAMEVLQ